MKKILLVIVCAFGMITSGSAQAFDSAVGLRLGRPLSVTYKKFISETNALEAYAGYRSWFGVSFLSVSAAYQIHKDLVIEDIDNLQWYYGAGAGVYLWTVDFGDGATSIGVQGYLGLSYTVDSAPVNISLDWIPTFFINGLDGFGSGFGGGYGSLGVRYILGADSEE